MTLLLCSNSLTGLKMNQWQKVVLFTMERSLLFMIKIDLSLSLGSIGKKAVRWICVLCRSPSSRSIHPCRRRHSTPRLNFTARAHRSFRCFRPYPCPAIHLSITNLLHSFLSTLLICLSYYRSKTDVFSY